MGQTFTISNADFVALKQEIFGVEKDAPFDIFGFRGLHLTKNRDGNFNGFLVDVNYLTPRCSIVIVDNYEKKAYPFLASTVPHKKFSEPAMKKGGAGANMMMFGRHQGYIRGVHKAGTPTGHKALRQTKKAPIRRSSNDLEFNTLDPVTFELPNDNIHAGWNMGKDHSYFASAGCQVISGYPECKQRGTLPATGDWAQFVDLIFNKYQEQKTFDYMLLPGRILFNLLKNSFYQTPLYFGCVCERVVVYAEAIQKFFKSNPKLGSFKIKSDWPSMFDWNLLNATLIFQKHAFGLEAADGIVGKQTFEALGLTW